ncbi:tryptase beta-2 [Nephila pilipes]|uniref:Tryptase beta-2 n=1 Tax=Nephila pilipes TaxID=299642 RepID=A0A8X6N4V8_NEPPI|nr:tryptase beta-2 [Nephila pilipes]
MSLNNPRCQGSNNPKECYMPASTFTVRLLGMKKLGKKLKVKAVIPHPKFDFMRIVNDIALLQLEQPVKCSGTTSPICLPNEKGLYKDGQKIIIAGWGKNMPSGFLYVDIYRNAAVHGQRRGTRHLYAIINMPLPVYTLHVLCHSPSPDSLFSSVPAAIRYHCPVGYLVGSSSIAGTTGVTRWFAGS